MPLAGRIALALVMAVAVAAAVPVDRAFAQAPPDDEAAKKEAQKFLKAGDKLLKRGDRFVERKRAEKAVEYYERALEAYQRAFDIYPKPQLYWLIGLAEQKLGRHLDALRHYQQLVKEVPELSDALRQQIDIQVAEAKQHVATLTFQVMPEGATISVDGEDIGTAPFDEPLYLEAGEHTIAVTAEGHTPFEENVSLEAGAESERTIGLDKIPVVVTKPKPKPEPVPPPPPEPSKTPLIIGVSVTGGLGALATVTGLLAVSKHGTFTDDSKPADERDSAADSGKTLALVTDLLWVGTIAAGAYTAYHYFRVYKPETERVASLRAQRRLWITPYASRSGGGVAVGGRF